MRELLTVHSFFWYLAIGTIIWFYLTGENSDLVQGRRDGRYNTFVVITITTMAILFWPRLVLAAIIGK